MAGIFLDASVLRNQPIESIKRFNIQQNNISFCFPSGLTQLSLIEECRALNALDVSDPDNFDLMYDMTMQMLTGKPTIVKFIEDDGTEHVLDKFVVTDKFMNLRGVDIIDEYPILVNWLVEFIAGMLGKKFPRSYKSVQEVMSERKERTKNLNKEKKQVKTSF